MTNSEIIVETAGTTAIRIVYQASGTDAGEQIGTEYLTPGTASEDELVQYTANYLGIAREITKKAFPQRPTTFAASPCKDERYGGPSDESDIYDQDWQPYAEDYSDHDDASYGGSGSYVNGSQTSNIFGVGNNSIGSPEQLQSKELRRFGDPDTQWHGRASPFIKNEDEYILQRKARQKIKRDEESREEYFHQRQLRQKSKRRAESRGNRASTECWAGAGDEEHYKVEPMDYRYSSHGIKREADIDEENSSERRCRPRREQGGCRRISNHLQHFQNFQYSSAPKAPPLPSRRQAGPHMKIMGTTRMRTILFIVF